MKKTLYLMRHAETMFNVQKRIQGWCDSPLTEQGKKQAKAMGRYFRDHHIQFDHAYTSTAERCCDTMELVTDMPYSRLKGLKEMFYGELEGESERLKCKTWQECSTYYLQFGGESSDTERDRMQETLTQIMQGNKRQSVLVVSHNAACFNFMRTVVEDPTEEWNKGFGNCTVFVYEYENDTFHLKEVLRGLAEGVQS